MATTRDNPQAGADRDAPEILDLPDGLTDSGVQQHTYSMDAIEVPADRYLGAQTQRSLINFSIGDDRMPRAVCHAYVKKAAAIINGDHGPDGRGVRGHHHRPVPAEEEI